MCTLSSITLSYNLALGPPPHHALGIKPLRTGTASSSSGGPMVGLSGPTDLENASGEIVAILGPKKCCPTKKKGSLRTPLQNKLIRRVKRVGSRKTRKKNTEWRVTNTRTICRTCKHIGRKFRTESRDRREKIFGANI